MNFLEAMRVSLRSIVANKMRAFLTMLGIIIGVASVIAMVSIGQGASQSVSQQIEGLGSNLLIITPGQAQQGGVRMGAGSLNTLTLNDIRSLQDQDAISGVTPDITKQTQVVQKDQSYTTTVEGTNEQFESVRNIKIVDGSFFTKYDVQYQTNVAVLGDTVIQNLFPNVRGSVVGQTIEINQIPFTIVGVMQSQGSSGATNNDDRVIIPVTTAMNRIFGTSNIRTIYASAKSADQMDEAQFEIEMAMRTSHNLKLQQSDDFQINSQQDILNTAQSISGILTVVLGGTAAISLLVGGIGIMNIMLVSVTERTREIGIRKAIGATKGNILTQFLIESVTLSVLGGIIGIGGGAGISMLITKFGNLSTQVSIASVAIAFLFSMVVGVVFGVYPASKASKLNPIDALRYE